MPLLSGALAKIRTSPLLKQGAWACAGHLGSAAGLLVGLRLLTEHVPPGVFGAAMLLLGIVGLCQGLVVTPLMQAVLRFYVNFRLKDRATILHLIAARLLRTFTMSAMVLLILGAIFYGALTKEWFWLALASLGAAILGVNAARSLELTFLNVEHQQQKIALWTATETWLQPMAAILVVMLWSPTPLAMLTGYLIASVFAYSLYRKSAGIEVRIRDVSETDSAKVSKGLVGYAIPLLPVAALAWASGIGDRYVVSGTLGIDSVGYYVAVYALMSRPFLMVGDIIELTLRQNYYDAVAAKSVKHARTVFLTWLGLAVTAGAIGFLLAFLFYSQIANWLLAESYRSGADLIPWIAGGYGLLMVSQVFTRICYANQDTGSVLMIETVGIVVRFGMLFPLVSEYGIVGAAAAVPLGFGVQLFTAIVLSRRSMLGKSRGRLGGSGVLEAGIRSE